MSQPSPTRWISRDLSHLYRELELAAGPDRQDRSFFDVVIVGSGYGGAMAAAELAGLQDGDGRPLRVLVLERGKEYTPGMFPSSGQELPGHIRLHRSKSGETTGRLDGLLDLRVGADVSALVANGLGGGSLINAGVMEIPDWQPISRLPQTLIHELTPGYMTQVKERLGALANGADNTIGGHPRAPGGTSKTTALDFLGGTRFHEAAVTIEMKPQQAGARYGQCSLCGDCLTGCNVGAKKSLDTSLLLEAWQKGAQIHTGASVIDLHRRADRTNAAPRWELTVVYTDEALRRRNDPLRLLAGKLILAAGTLGSPEILMRSESYGLRFSPRLGQQFSCNGDNILAVQGTGREVGTVASENEPLAGRCVGSTITGVVRMPAGATGPGFLIEEFAVPASLKRVFDEVVTTSSLVHRLTDNDGKAHGRNDTGLDELAVDPVTMKQVLLLGLVGHDESNGQLRLPDPVRLDDSRAVEGRIRIDWPGARNSRLLDEAFHRAEQLIHKRWPDSRVLPNPIWRMLPPELDFVFHSERGPLLTVHPLGGCPIGPNALEGVVDEFGQVFDFGTRSGPGGTHPGLLVLDGSILPASLGVNPALTIAAIAQRAARRLSASAGWVDAKPVLRLPQTRTRLRSEASCTPPDPVETKIELIERLNGPVRIRQDHYMVELTLQYRPQGLRSLATRMGRNLTVEGPLSTLRLYSKAQWDSEGIGFLDEPARRLLALVEAPVGGGLSLLQREAAPAWKRALRGAWAYLRNRGLRDLWSMGKEWLQRKMAGEPVAALSLRGTWETLKRLCALATRAGEVRRFDYNLTLGPPKAGGRPELASLLAGRPAIHGYKRLTYSPRGNPWRQLSELQLSDFLALPRDNQPLLTLDGRFMARHGVPLARIASQQNQMVAMAEIASFTLYFLRLFLSIHLWSVRAPDPARPRTLHLLPGPIQGLPRPRIYEIELEPPRRGIPVLVRLTRYRGKLTPATGKERHPLVLIHGYSTSGTTFTHEAIPEPMARYFWQQGHDVWLLDLRTSCGMASNVLPWNFEDAALADIPVAIGKIVSVTGRKQVNVFAHCIGAVMLSMSLLTDREDEIQLAQIEDVDPPDGVRARRYMDEVAALGPSIHKIVLSQKGPVPVYSDGNMLRAYLMRVLRNIVLPANYQFRVPAEPSLADQAFDRLLASMPYPDDELARESPMRPWVQLPWAGFRHRMDALFSHDFCLRNVSDKTLASLEDLFGPPNLDTVSQAVHFARYNKITNASGRNCFVTVSRMQHRWPRGGTLSIHGRENGLADVRTLGEMGNLMRESEHHGDFEALAVDGLGHQDCLIGTTARQKFFQPIHKFLSR
jgi:cholesterol oxidase